MGTMSLTSQCRSIGVLWVTATYKSAWDYVEEISGSSFPTGDSNLKTRLYIAVGSTLMFGDRRRLHKLRGEIYLEFPATQVLLDTKVTLISILSILLA